MRYDPLGRLYEVVSPTTGTTRFLYGGDELLAEYDGAGNLLRRYVHGADGKADDPLAWYEGSSFAAASERFLRPDWQGSIGLVTDNAGGTVYGVNTYDEYGIPGTGNSGRFQYTGQAWLAELGMYYYKARSYSPTLGRFLQTDPIGYKDQVNLYAYVANDPVDHVDFKGEEAACVTLNNCGHAADTPEKQKQAAFTLGAMAAVLTGGTGLVAALPAATEAATVVAGPAVEQVAVNTARAAGTTATQAGATSSSATTGLVHQSGQTFSGASTGAGGSGITNSTVQAAYDSVPKAAQSAFHGLCGEASCLSAAANAGAKLEGSVMATVRAGTGKLLQACPSCAAAARYLGVTVVEP